MTEPTEEMDIRWLRHHEVVSEGWTDSGKPMAGHHGHFARMITRKVPVQRREGIDEPLLAVRFVAGGPHEIVVTPRGGETLVIPLDAHRVAGLIVQLGEVLEDMTRDQMFTASLSTVPNRT